MPGVLFRLARHDDVPALVQLAAAFREYLEMPEPSDAALAVALPERLRDPATEFLVAEDGGGRLVAFLQLRLRETMWYGREAEIEDLYVAGGSRQAGIGRGLIGLAIERARLAGCRHLSLTTNENNRAAVALYEACGLDARRARWQGGRQLWLDRMLLGSSPAADFGRET